MPVDASFYYIAIPAVILVGLSKGGMGDALGLLGVPILTFVVPPAQAAAILLPILIVMDVASLWMWRKHNNAGLVKLLLPGALIGIAFGWATWVIVPKYVMQLVIGAVALSFTARFFYNRYFVQAADTVPRQHGIIRAGFWGALSGYGSFVAHAGGAPFQVYGLPLKLPPRDYTGAAVRFFAILNAVKLIPYFMLGQLDFTNLYLSATLFPLAPLATIAGALIVRRMRPDVFYPFMYGMCALAGMKLAYEGVMPLLALASKAV
ncbi:sulfite exporter TauE/SafE family protein [Rhizobium sp. KVB221]|uniref:Probable membrane transporter protein n=1 Tax=Rhizobium setariae TaxID=2801340 RepID=A0A936YQT3_9HYPH|nr:sulfite exporter TauE/SafE family protein [Rhizobium setariae]MBL0374998.1 sulfite exporter TauE/SafE family protein [Rhizobium setariae]